MTLEQVRRFKGHYNPDVAELAQLAEERLLLEQLSNFAGSHGEQWGLNEHTGATLGESIRKAAGMSEPKRRVEGGEG